MKCQSGFTYNALTTACEAGKWVFWNSITSTEGISLAFLGPCTFDSTLCENEGRCVDDLTTEKGFKCVCSNQYEGEFCEHSKSVINESSNDPFECVLTESFLIDFFLILQG